MATLLTCQSVSKHFGTRRLFEGLSISFADKERVGFLGPNGAGKTTFLRILAGEITPDDGGDIERRRNATICFVPQEESFPNDATVDSVLTDAIADQPLEPYQRDARISIITSQFGFEQTDQPVDHLSGGWRKRLALARAFVQEPDLLLMDEPTNHLDLSGITWLEDTLLNTPFAFLVVSHDRYFLERVTNRVVELNRIYPDGYFSVSGNYSKFLEKRADFLAAQQTQEETLKNLVRREVTFLRSHAKARRSKSKSRIDDAYRIQDELKTIKDRTSGATSARIDFEGTGRRSKKLLEAKNLAKTLGQKLLFEDVSVFLSPGTRLGLLGANGSGKTTLIRLLVGALPPDQGTVQPADDVRIVVFDQKREALPQDLTLKQALAGRDDSVDFRGQSIHITSWAKRFLFRTDQLDMPVGELSGGEQARILIARLMRQPADILILDEPTNDLDIASLDVLETSLTEFPGAIVLVTHDRHMLDRVCTEILGISGHGPVGRYTSCAHWQTTQQEKSKSAVTEGPKEKAAKKQKRQRKRLSASETKDLQLMEQTIQDAEQRVDVCRQAVEDPAIATDHVEVQKRWDAMEAAKKEVEALYTRWQELEAKLAALEEDDG